MIQACSCRRDRAPRANVSSPSSIARRIAGSSAAGRAALSRSNSAIGDNRAYPDIPRLRPWPSCRDSWRNRLPPSRLDHNIRRDVRKGARRSDPEGTDQRRLGPALTTSSTRGVCQGYPRAPFGAVQGEERARWRVALCVAQCNLSRENAALRRRRERAGTMR